jgi:quinol monooxygenase YgiN
MINVKRCLLLGIAICFGFFAATAMSEPTPHHYVQMAEIEIDPAQLDSYNAAVKEHIETAIRVEPGVLLLYAAAEKDNPSHVRVFEVYQDREAYLAHLQAPHFLKYKATTENMVTSLKLVPLTPVMLGAKSK